MTTQKQTTQSSPIYPDLPKHFRAEQIIQPQSATADREKSNSYVRTNRYEKLTGDQGTITASPSPSDRVAIIGAGPAGLHMAYLLKERNFSNVVVFEKSDRVAGKSFTSTEFTPDVPQEFGTCYTVPCKYQELRRVSNAINYTDFEEVPVPPRNFYNTPGDPAHQGQYRYIISKKLEKEPFAHLSSPLKETLAALAVGMDLFRYRDYVRNLFDEKSMEEIIDRTNDKTFLDFLRENDFDDLEPLFRLTHTGQGYGYLDQIPAFYGIWWNDDASAQGFLPSVVGGDITIEDPASILRKGFQPFWEFLRTQQNIDVRYVVDITSIERGNDVVSINAGGKTFQFDFVIVACNLQDAMQFLTSIDPVEEELLSSLTKQANLTTTLVAVNHTMDQVSINTWQNSLLSANEMRLITLRDSGKLFHEGEDDYNEDGKDFLMAYQYNSVSDESSAHTEELLSVLTNDLAAVGFNGVEVKEQHPWPYFLRWDADGLKNRNPIRMMQRQGTNKTWFIGASVVFESVDDVMEYNRALVNLMDTQRAGHAIKRARYFGKESH